MFENKKTEVQKVHYSRYIASWNKCGGHYYGEQFIKWLKFNECTDQEIDDICEMARCGKMELEMTAKSFVKKMTEMFNQIDNNEDPEEEP